MKSKTMTSNTMAKSLNCQRALILALYLSGTPLSFAEDSPHNLEFRGTLLEPPPCEVNQKDTLKISFGDKVGIKKVASGVYRQPIPLNIQCEPSSAPWRLMLSVRGTATGFDTDNASVVSAQQPDLGVKFFLAGKPLSLDKAQQVNASTPPEMEAVLVQRAGSELLEGTFTAQATLRAEYQ